MYNTNSPSASMVTIIRNHLHMCACAMCTSCGYYLRAAIYFIQELRIVQLLFEGGDYSRAATIQRWRLFEGGDYSRAVTV